MSRAETWTENDGALERELVFGSFREAIAYLEIPVSRTELIEREIGKLKLELDDDRRAIA